MATDATSSDAFVAALARDLGQREDQRLSDCLAWLAARLQMMSGITGAMVIAVDAAGGPLAAGEAGLSLVGGTPPLVTLGRLTAQLARMPGAPPWSPAPACFRLADGAAPPQALPIDEVRADSSTARIGYLVVSSASLLPITALQDVAPLCHLPIRDARRGDAVARGVRIQELMRELDDRPAAIEAMLRGLRVAFTADAVTLLLDSHGKLRLAGSTDPTITAKGPVVYHRTEPYLTSWVFREGRALRIANTCDPDEVRVSTGLIDRIEPKHPEHALDGTRTVQLIAAPLRRGPRIVGVIRVSRLAGTENFTSEDLTSLQAAADLLGTHFADRIELHLARSVFDSAGESIIASVREGLDGEPPSAWDRIIWASKGAEILTGRDKASLLGSNACYLYPGNQLARVRDFLHAGLKAGRDSHGPLETSLSMADGTLRPIEITFRTVTDPLLPEPIRYTIGIARDVGARDPSSRERQGVLGLLDRMGVAYFRASGGTTSLTSQAECDITGYTREELTSTDFRRDDLHAVAAVRRRLLEKARDNGGQLTRELVKFVRKDGTKIFIEADLFVVGEDPATMEVEGVYRDVSSRIKLQNFIDAGDAAVLDEDEIFTRLKAFARFNVDYLITFRHQVISPLAAVRDTLLDLRESMSAAGQSDRRIDQLLGLVKVCIDLLDNQVYLDKILRGQTFDKRLVDLRRLAIDVSIDFKYQLKDRNLRLRVEIDDAADNLIMGHSGLLYQVLVNLVDNAIKYSFERSTIFLRSRSTRAGYTLEVDNLGLRIAPEERERVFVQGYRGRKAYAAVPDGTGLGLWLARRIVELHGGKLTCAESIVDRRARTVFRLQLPRPSGR